MLNKEKIAIIGLGYVGLPLLVELAKFYEVVGFDIKKDRITELNGGLDKTGEVSKITLKETIKSNVKFTNCSKDIRDATVYICTVPTPVDEFNIPDLTMLKHASELVGKQLSPNDLVVYESTVYPGATEEICVPILEKHSALKCGDDFDCGYSPERINPGDNKNKISDIVKIISGNSDRALSRLKVIYSKIISAGLYEADSIKVAEAAKVIENTQRDVNVALVNEFSIIFEKLGIDTASVLKAAATKWNFMPFVPGLVGGHCISVDPYYLAHKATQVGLSPEMITTARRINDNMGGHVAKKFIKLLLRKNKSHSPRKVLVMGLTFKEDCPDLRNTGSIKIIRELEAYGLQVDVHDPVCSVVDARQLYGLNLVDLHYDESYRGIIFAVGHSVFKELKYEQILKLCENNPVIMDLKAIYPRSFSDYRL